MFVMLITTALLTVTMTFAPSIALPALIGTITISVTGGMLGILLLIIPQTLKDLHII